MLMAGPDICILCRRIPAHLRCRYLLPNLYLSVADIANPVDLL